MNNSRTIVRWNNIWQFFPKDILFRPNIKIINEVLKIFNKKINKLKILEVGAGSSSDSITLAKLGAKCYALDFSPEALRVCQKAAKKQGVKIFTINADCQKIPYKNNFFNVVFSAGLIEHFKNPIPILKEQLRVLDKKGYLIVDVPQRYNLYTISKHLRMIFNTHPFGWETEYSKKNLQIIGAKLKLKLIKIYGRDSALSNHLPTKLNKIWKKFFIKIESSKLAPYFCLHIGAIYQKI